jgi:hypothetical protein
MISKQLIRATALLLFSMCVCTVAAYTQVAYRNFRNTSGLNLIGDATAQGKKIRLLPAKPNTRGGLPPPSLSSTPTRVA